MTTAATASQVNPAQATVRMKMWTCLYQGHPGIQIDRRKQNGRWIWKVTQPGSPAAVYPDSDAMMAALLSEEPQA